MPAAASADPPRVLSAQWFDGRSSRARPVQIALQRGPDGARLHLRALDGERERLNLAPDEVGWPERWSARRAPPRVAVDLGAHGSLQVDDVAGWQAALAAAHHRRSLAERMQTQWPVLLGVLLVAGAGVGAFSARAVVAVCALHVAMVCPLPCNSIPRPYDRAAWPSTTWGTKP